MKKLHGQSIDKTQSYPPVIIKRGNGTCPFKDDFPIKTTLYRKFAIATFDDTGGCCFRCHIAGKLCSWSLPLVHLEGNNALDANACLHCTGIQAKAHVVEITVGNVSWRVKTYRTVTWFCFVSSSSSLPVQARCQKPISPWHKKAHLGQQKSGQSSTSCTKLHFEAD